MSNNQQLNYFQNRDYYQTNGIYNSSHNFNNSNHQNNNTNNNIYSLNNSYQTQTNSNENIYQYKYPNSNFDFDKKMDYLLLTNAFTKLRNENKSYEELENFALKLEIANIKYSKKHENMKYEIVRLNQKIIDLNSYIKENEIDIKKLLNKICFLEKDREIIFSRLQSQEFNYVNNGNNINSNIQNQQNEQENNLLEEKYLVKTTNDLDNNPVSDEYNSETESENSESMISNKKGADFGAGKQSFLIKVIF